LTSIYKEPVSGTVHVRELNLDGDKQSDLTVHGGPEKAVYVYPKEHYSFWRKELPGADSADGWFGENLTTEGLLENETFIGDELRIGSAEFVVTQPRMPCFKLGIRFGRADIIKRFLDSRLTGFYLSVVKEGDLSAGQPIERLSRGSEGIPVTEITDLYVDRAATPDRLRRAASLASLPLSWRDYFSERIAAASA
jgi:MOSC domain-containing protein YiiM